MTKFEQLLDDRVPLPAPQSQSGDLTKPFNRNSSLKSKNCNALSPARQSFTRLPRPFGQGKKLAGSLDADSPSKKPATSKSRPGYLAG
ncbi:hypothetical protein [Phaffia rhodozyma]|uniref:Uncharacterized protein n=1 Tax=Phaffia rhodozyma TaxID=264483 RepID=A0A0F7SH03_PHARH|nr:hypothetical protein [Phaffia rhodozyma]